MSKQQATCSIRHVEYRMLQVACCFDMLPVAVRHFAGVDGALVGLAMAAATWGHYKNYWLIAFLCCTVNDEGWSSYWRAVPAFKRFLCCDTSAVEHLLLHFADIMHTVCLWIMTLLCYGNLQTWVFCHSFNITEQMSVLATWSHISVAACILLQCSVCEYYWRQTTSRWPWWAVCWSLSCVTVTMTTDRCFVTTWRYWRPSSRSGDLPFKCQLRESSTLLHYTVTPPLLLQVCLGCTATCWRCDGKYYMGFLVNFVRLSAVKEFWKSVKIWQN